MNNKQPNGIDESSDASAATVDSNDIPASAADDSDPSATADSPAQPRMTVERQYVRSSTLESLAGNDRFSRQLHEPEIKVGIEVGAHQIATIDGEGDNVKRFEITLTAETKATDPKSGTLPLFTATVSYAGIFVLVDVPQQQRHLALGIEAPRLLFPFVRHILGNMTRDSGFPPVMLDTIDFAALMRERAAAEAESAQNQQQ